ncbi:MAG: hypothetical protein MUE41_18090 [Gemmatimonadaceae bacterium]|nr:hypothetical protein [Gemmatimonadaceae bacterium]
MRAAIVSNADRIDELAVNAATENRGACRLQVGAGTAMSVERDAFLAVLERVQWDTVAAAGLLGVSRKTVYSRIARYALSIPAKHHRRRATAAAEAVA